MEQWIRQTEVVKAGYYWLLEVGSKKPYIVRLQFRSDRGESYFVCKWADDGDDHVDWRFTKGKFNDGDDGSPDDMYLLIEEPSLGGLVL